MKLIVKTTGPFGLIDSLHGQEIPKARPVVVYHSAKVAQFLKRKHLEKICDVPDTATDEDFLAVWKESKGDVDLAVAAYISELGVEAPPADEGTPATPKNKGKAKKAE